MYSFVDILHKILTKLNTLNILNFYSFAWLLIKLFWNDQEMAAQVRYRLVPMTDYISRF